MRVWTHFFLFFFLSNTSTCTSIVNMWCDIFRSKMLLLLVFFQLFFLASSFHWKDLLLSQLNPLNPKPSIVRILSLLSDGLVWAQKIYEFFHTWPCRLRTSSSKTNTLHLPKNIIFTLCKSLLSPKLWIFTQIHVIPLLFIRGISYVCLCEKSTNSWYFF